MSRRSVEREGTSHRNSRTAVRSCFPSSCLLVFWLSRKGTDRQTDGQTAVMGDGWSVDEGTNALPFPAELSLSLFIICFFQPNPLRALLRAASWAFLLPGYAHRGPRRASLGYQVYPGAPVVSGQQQQQQQQYMKTCKVKIKGGACSSLQSPAGASCAFFFWRLIRTHFKL